MIFVQFSEKNNIAYSYAKMYNYSQTNRQKKKKVIARRNLLLPSKREALKL